MEVIMISPIQYFSTGMIDVSSTVNTIMSQQASQLNSLNSMATSYQTSISDFGQLSSSLSAFQTAAQAFINPVTPPNSTTLTTNITNFVTAYNNLVSTMNGLNNSNFLGSNTLSSLQNTIQNTLGSTQSALNTSNYNGLAQIGITTQADGTLAINSTTLNNAITTNLNNVQAIFSNSGKGVADQLNNQLQGYLQTGGIIYSDTYNLQQALSNVQNTQQQTIYGQSLMSSTLTNQYSSLNVFLYAKQVTSALLAAQQQSMFINNLQQSLLSTQKFGF